MSYELKKKTIWVPIFVFEIYLFLGDAGWSFLRLTPVMPLG